MILLSLRAAYHGQNSQKLSIGNHSIRVGCKGLWESDPTLGRFRQNTHSLLVDANKRQQCNGRPRGRQGGCAQGVTPAGARVSYRSRHPAATPAAGLCFRIFVDATSHLESWRRA